jgi:VIT1/CCC1 family predicted Fe2+/Mn2+ transporter
VAQQLMAHDALGAHARDELGLSDQLAARPLQAALASAGTFAVGASRSCCRRKRGSCPSSQVHP